MKRPAPLVTARVAFMFEAVYKQSFVCTTIYNMEIFMKNR